MDDFKKYLRNIGLCDKSIRDDMSRINMMISRGIDFTKGEEAARGPLYKSNLSESSIRSCLRLCRRYHEYLERN